MKISRIILAISTLSGTIIGVGLFSLPFITSKVGIWIMLGYFAVLGVLVILVHRFFGEVVLETEGQHRLPGYAGIYLGKKGKTVAIVSTILGLLGALLAYLIVGGEFLTALLSPQWGGGNQLYTLLYFSVGAILIFFGIKAIAKIEFFGLILFFAVLAAIFFRGMPFMDADNIFFENWKSEIGKYFFLPYGAILFSLWGAALIPEIKEMLADSRLTRKIIAPAIIIPAFVYLIFIFLVLGITGSQTSSEAIVGLKNFLGDGIVTLALFFGLLTTFTSFITLGLTLKKVFWYDLKIPKNAAWLITILVPMMLYFAGLQDFIKVIGLVGAVMLGIDGILIILMYLKIVPGRKFLIYPLILMFLAGIVYEVIYFIQ